MDEEAHIIRRDEDFLLEEVLGELTPEQVGEITKCRNMGDVFQDSGCSDPLYLNEDPVEQPTIAPTSPTTNIPTSPTNVPTAKPTTEDNILLDADKKCYTHSTAGFTVLPGSPQLFPKQLSAFVLTPGQVGEEYVASIDLEVFVVGKYQIGKRGSVPIVEQEAVLELQDPPGACSVFSKPTRL